MKKQKTRWGFIILVVVFLILLGFIFAGFISLFTSDIENFGGNTALIPIKGVIVSDGAGDLFEAGASSTEIIKLIKKADSNPNIKAIIFEINSPGGTPVASEEITNAIKRTNKTTVAWIREVGASGAYWIASATDHIVASRMSLTGSIGVLASYLELAGFLEDHNVTYRRLVAGKYKDIGSPFKEITSSEELLLQKSINQLHDYFIDDVVKNRKLTQQQKLRISDALFYTGAEAKELGLVDVLGSKEEAIRLIEDKLDITVNLVEYKKEKTIFDALSRIFSEQSFFVGKGIGSAILSKRLSNEISITT
ncbi:signal peptide peptidase SppA [Candidatus Woesearchaeota archaeon]|nr:signal peptide peptidase SppA [Candidatus Woesearchaeota archaeon]